MTHSDVERELRDHYRSLDAGSPGRAASRVADALDQAPAHRWSLGRFIPARALLTAGATVAVVAALTVALLPLWHGSFESTGASGQSPTPQTSASAPASPSAGASRYAQATPGTVASPDGSPSAAPILVGAQFAHAGKSRSGMLWAVRNSRLDISTDHGRTWHESTLPQGPSAGSTVQDVTIANATHALVVMTTNPAPGDPNPPVSTIAAIYVTDNGGTTWRPAVSRTLGGAVEAQLIFADAMVGFAILTPQTASGPGTSTIMRTLDGGATWAVAGAITFLGSPVWAMDENTIWVTSFANWPSTAPLLQVSRDGGATWSAVSLPGVDNTDHLAASVMRDSFGGPIFFSADEGYLAVAHQTTDFETLYYRTLDGGRTWSIVATVPRAVMGGTSFVDATHWYQLAADGASMEATADGGRTWTIVGMVDPPGPKVTEVVMTDAQNGVAVGTDDGWSLWSLYFTWDGGKTWQPADFSAR
jgi:photosystem II stability/assembly factor-like uncharacterized protein